MQFKKCYLNFLSLMGKNQFDVNKSELSAFKFIKNKNADDVDDKFISQVKKIVEFFKDLKYSKIKSKNLNIFLPDEFLTEYLKIDDFTPFPSLENLREFYFLYVFHFLYVELQVEEKANIPLDKIISLQIENLSKTIPIIANNEIKTDSLIYKITLSSFYHFKEGFSFNKHIDKKDASNYKTIRTMLKKIIPDIYNPDLNANNILKHLRKNELNHIQFHHLLFKHKHSMISKYGLKLALVNLGPGDIELICLSNENVTKFDAHLQTNYKMSLKDLYSHDTQANIKIEMLFENRIQVNYSILNKHEMVFMPEGSLFFYTTRKESASFVYEYGTKQVNQFDFLFNKNLQFISQGIKPYFKVNTLLMDILNKESVDLEFTQYGYDKLNNLINNEKEDLKILKENLKCKIINILPEPEDVNSRFCNLCLNELFNYFSFCKVCDLINRNQLTFKCLKCIIKSCGENCQKYLVVYYKYTQESLDLLLDRINRNISGHNLNFYRNNIHSDLNSSYQNEISGRYKSHLHSKNSESKDSAENLNITNSNIAYENSNVNNKNKNMKPILDLFPFDFPNRFEDSREEDILDLAKIQNEYLNFDTSVFNPHKSLPLNDDPSLNFLDF